MQGKYLLLVSLLGAHAAHAAIFLEDLLDNAATCATAGGITVDFNNRVASLAAHRAQPRTETAASAVVTFRFVDSSDAAVDLADKDDMLEGVYMCGRASSQPVEKKHFCRYTTHHTFYLQIGVLLLLSYRSLIFAEFELS